MPTCGASWTSLVCERGFELHDGRVRATARIRNAGAEATSLIVVEHLILGGRMAAEGTRIALEGGSRHRAGVGRNAGGLALSPGRCSATKTSRCLPATTSRFAVVRDLAAGTARVTAPDRLMLDVRFDHAAFPHLWLWEERFGATVEPWNGGPNAWPSSRRASPRPTAWPARSSEARQPARPRSRVRELVRARPRSDRRPRVTPSRVVDVEAIPLVTGSGPTDLDAGNETVLVRVTDEDGRVGVGEADAPARVVRELVEMDDLFEWSRGLRSIVVGLDPSSWPRTTRA